MKTGSSSDCSAISEALRLEDLDGGREVRSGERWGEVRSGERWGRSGELNGELRSDER